MGSAEQISARIAAVMQMNTALMRKDVHIGRGPPARIPIERTTLSERNHHKGKLKGSGSS